MGASTSFTLSQLISTVRERADMVNSQFVTDAELTTYINQARAELYDIMIQAFGNDYFVATPYTFQTTGTANYLYPLPSDFYKLLGVDLQISPNPNGWVTLRRFEFADRNTYSLQTGLPPVAGLTNVRYRVNGSNIWFMPVPAAGLTVQLWYIPSVSYLVNPTDTLDGVSGWEAYVIADAAMKCLAKEESDTSALAAEKQSLLNRINSAVENRDAGQPSRVSDSQSEGDAFGAGMLGRRGWGF